MSLNKNLAIIAISPEQFDVVFSEYKKKQKHTHSNRFIDPSKCDYCDNSIELMENTWCDHDKFYHHDCYELYLKNKELFSKEITTHTTTQTTTQTNTLTTNNRIGCIDGYGFYNILKSFYDTLLY